MIDDKSLKDKAIDIKGKEYVLVSDRIKYFNEFYPNGYIQTALLSQPEDTMVVCKAMIVPDAKEPSRFFVGHSQAKWGEGMVNKTAALENCETSAVGRALAMMGIGVIDSVASADEMKKSGYGISEVTTPKNSPEPQPCLKCNKGMMIYKTGVKNGREWAGYFCNACDNKMWVNLKVTQVDPADQF